MTVRRQQNLLADRPGTLCLELGLDQFGRFDDDQRLRSALGGWRALEGYNEGRSRANTGAFFRGRAYGRAGGTKPTLTESPPASSTLEFRDLSASARRRRSRQHQGRRLPTPLGTITQRPTSS